MAEEKRLGPWLLREEVAAGAFSVTWLCEHAELGRAALIKTLKPSVAPGGPLTAGLEREARILARLRHPAVLAIQDLRREGGALGLVLEPASGPTLAALSARAGRLDPDVATAIALEIARGLGHAHERGVVHCALAPDHVVLLPGGELKIIEWSAAHEIAAGDDQRAFEALTLERPDAMAPEQILGEPPGPPADVFALGVLLHETITGEGPFGPADTAGRAVAHRIRHEPPRPLRALAPEAPRSLEAVALRCLEKEPEQRYPDGRAVAAALEEVLTERGYLPGAAPALIARALAAAKLGAPTGRRAPAIAEPARLPEVARRRSLAEEARPLLAVLALVVMGGAAIELGLRERDEPASPGVSSDLEDSTAPRGYLRVLARPWAEVSVDGDLVDVTPIGRPIPVSPGRHYVTFRHPNAPEEKRELIVAPGQTVLVDVTLRVDRGPRDAGAEAAPRDESP